MDDGQAQSTLAPTRAVSPEQSGPLRIALIGWFGSGNFGNDASCEAFLAFLRETLPDARLSCICNDPEGLAKRFGVATARLRWRPRRIAAMLDTLLLRIPSALVNWIYALRTLARTDLLLFPGTGIFDDYRSGPLGSPSQTLRWCAAARLRGAKVAFVSVGAGTILNPLSRWMLGAAAKLAHHRSYRDEESRAFMAAMGVDESGVQVLPDVVYLLETPPHEDRPEGAPLTIGLGVMSYHGWREDEAGAAMYEDYVSKLTRLVEWLAERGRRVRLLVGEDSDWRTVRKLEDRLSAKAAAAVDPTAEMRNLHDLMREIAHTDIVVATRFHVAICALKLARPTVSLSYGFKNDAALTAAGLDGFFQRVEYFDFDLLIEHLNKLEAERLGYAAIIRERVAGFEAQLRAKDAMLPAALLRR